MVDNRDDRIVMDDDEIDTCRSAQCRSLAQGREQQWVRRRGQLLVIPFDLFFRHVGR